MIEPYELIWISPILSQAETEGLFYWVNLHLTETRLKPLSSFSKIRVEILTEPKECLKLSFPVHSIGVEHSIELFKEAIWCEILANTQPVSKPLAISFLPSRILRIPRKLVCFDMDSTLINQEVIDEIARSNGLFDQVSKITASAMEGQVDFKTSLKDRVKLFRGLSIYQFENVIPSLTLTEGAEKLLGQLKYQGVRTAIVSGGFELILNHFKKELDIDQVHGNKVQIDEKQNLTGELIEPIIDAEAKRSLVSKMKANYHAEAAETIAVGDGANDIPMMSLAGISVSFCGKPKLASFVNTLIFDRNLLWLQRIGEY